ncbi:MAG: hypothetical protein GC157_11595 [Frankiales bacterium]|nr:hypothetical protein [Frankiales bacterium]
MSPEAAPASRFAPAPVPAAPVPATDEATPAPPLGGDPAPPRSNDPAAAPVPGAPGGVERRRPGRPWSDRTAAADSSDAAATTSGAERRAPRAAAPDPQGYVLFAVGSTVFAAAVGEVHEVVRAARIELLADRSHPLGRGVALVDARGRSVPVVDLRQDPDEVGDVLLPVYRRHVGVVVDRVLAVLAADELPLEDERVPESLPGYARGVLRPEGGEPVLLVELPSAAELESDAERPPQERLGADVLALVRPPAPS